MPRVQPIIKPAKILLVGEAAGEQEELTGLPFVGRSGQELNQMLKEVGLERSECAITNVFLSRPPDNNLDAWCVKKGEADDAYPHFLQTVQDPARWPARYAWPPLRQGKYIHPEHLSELPRLAEEIAAVRPNVIVALGASACWALLNNPGIKAIRGTVAECTLVPGFKVLPTYHPAYVLRQWGDRPIVLADLTKVKRHAKSPILSRPKREIWIEPTLDDIREFKTLYLDRAEKISYDIETARRQITCIGFSPSRERALVIPFVDKRKPGYNYWESIEEEIQAWNLVAEILALPAAKITHNGSYDMQYTWRAHGIPIHGPFEDTMLLQHSIQPEMEKSLGFLGSIYTDEVSWKLMRRHTTEEKKED